jgi:hypothetical protein
MLVFGEADGREADGRHEVLTVASSAPTIAPRACRYCRSACW